RGRLSVLHLSPLQPRRAPAPGPERRDARGPARDAAQPSLLPPSHAGDPRRAGGEDVPAACGGGGRSLGIGGPDAVRASGRSATGPGTGDAARADRGGDLPAALPPGAAAPPRAR